MFLIIYRRYAAVVFVACLRFEMNKRKLQFLTFPDLYHCANSMMASWTYRCVGSEYFDTDLDREFLQELSECRVLLENDKHHKQYVESYKNRVTYRDKDFIYLL